MPKPVSVPVCGGEHVCVTEVYVGVTERVMRGHLRSRGCEKAEKAEELLPSCVEEQAVEGRNPLEAVRSKPSQPLFTGVYV